MRHDNIESLLREHKPQVKDNPAFLSEVQHKMGAVEGLKKEMDRQRRFGRIALVAALVIGTLIGGLAIFLIWMYPAGSEVGTPELIKEIKILIEHYRQYVLLLIACCAISSGVILGRKMV
ncbi:MAG: hypothetical protein J6S16_05210 [Bacteroidales bacterium]|nr:hypothetical protein [Bacteroidales bacterium]MBO7764324.1 hypothetical protein [Bacteroidales bacterium]